MVEDKKTKEQIAIEQATNTGLTLNDAAAKAAALQSSQER